MVRKMLEMRKKPVDRKEIYRLEQVMEQAHDESVVE